jgi:hypothetical protein
MVVRLVVVMTTEAVDTNGGAGSTMMEADNGGDGSGC